MSQPLLKTQMPVKSINKPQNITIFQAITLFQAITFKDLESQINLPIKIKYCDIL